MEESFVGGSFRILRMPEETDGQVAYVLLDGATHGLKRGTVPTLDTSNFVFKDFCRSGSCVVIHGVRGSFLGFGVPRQGCGTGLPAHLRVAQAVPAGGC